MQKGKSKVHCRLEKSLQNDYLQFLRQEEEIWAIKFIMQWIQDKDWNTQTYHLATIIRIRQNEILKLKNECGEWMDSSIFIKDHILKTFDQRFFTSHDKDVFDTPRPTFWNVFLEENDKSLLVRIPTENVIFQGLKSLKPTKALIRQIHQEGGELVFKTQSIFLKNLPLFERATARNSERVTNQNSEIAINQI